MVRKSSRRKVSVLDQSRWVFNRMAHVYDARPDYPASLVDAVADLVSVAGRRLGDLGAGIGHFALPLAERGFEVTAIEPALAMLERLRVTAAERKLAVRALHAAAEALPLDGQSLDAILIADALHFIDTELAAREIARVLVPGGMLVVVSCKFGPTPFMQQLTRVMAEASQREPRKMGSRHAQLAGVAGIPLLEERRIVDETEVTHAELERILSSISFIGPAMNEARRAAFRARVHALAGDRPVVWSREFTVRWGRGRGI